MTQIQVRPHLELLGFKVRDKVSGFEGVVTSIGFDLMGCVQCIVSPAADNTTGKKADSHWLDYKRLTKLSEQPVMDTPDFAYDVLEVPQAVEARRAVQGPVSKSIPKGL